MFDTNEQFTESFQKWLDKFLKDLSKNKNLILEKLKDFKGEKTIVEEVINKGIENIDNKDTEIAKTLFNFIEFYSTNNISNIGVSLVENVN